MKNLNFATRWNADTVEQYYEQWLDNPDRVDPKWQVFFEGFELGQTRVDSGNGETEAKTNGNVPPTLLSKPSEKANTDPGKQAAVIGAIYAYRSIGHTQANINPLFEPEPNPRLAMDYLGLSEEDLDYEFNSGNYLGGMNIRLRDLLDRLRQTYCGPVGCEYIHIQETAKRRWLQKKMEPNNNLPRFSPEKQIHILRKLKEAEIFESFLHTRYVGQKRFSLEGAETLIPLIDTIVQKMPDHDMKEVVMGMAHRGRLNMLANVMGKSYQFIFNEFSENYIPDMTFGDGDVKYHLGYESTYKTLSGKDIEIRLAANPSHLEAVDPIVEGKARARQRLRGDLERRQVLPILIHGDAAIAGQGIVAEVFNFSKLPGYRTGGTLHVVVNNQIGFTTQPEDARSSRYCTDIAKMIEAPIFHVNGDDVLATAMVTELALEYRQEFGEDVVIDMYCYRKHGHNESDEPKFTQPVIYKKIDELPKKSEILSNRLIDEGILDREEAGEIEEEYKDTLNQAFERAKKSEKSRHSESKLFGSTAVFQPRFSFQPVPTASSYEDLENVARVLTAVPDDFKINPKIKRQIDRKWTAFENNKGIDWAFAELLAFGTLMLDGHSVRLSGQDSKRGTFSQRHSTWYDIETRERYVPLKQLEEGKAQFCCYNSLLSEAAVLGFDFGYSLDYPGMLAIWEAQFGDFVNGAQVIIDQFITSSESKWQRVSNLVMLLPHGYEGQGPEHSSARLERFLQACAENNIQVTNLTTPANYFHALRRQMKREFRKPLVNMAPKSLLRSKDALSLIESFTDEGFQEIVDDPNPPDRVEKIILCSGKVYYDLFHARKEFEDQKTAIIRIEQLYPLHTGLLKKMVAAYPHFKKLVWCQEEPANMGAWNYIRQPLEDLFGINPDYAGREEAASPATGSLAIHNIEQRSLIESAFKL